MRHARQVAESFTHRSGGYGELQVENSGQDVIVLDSSTARGQTDGFGTAQGC